MSDGTTLEKNNQEWISIDSVPKNGTRFKALMKDGTIYEDTHWASDLSGCEQPPFEGFFKTSRPGEFVQIDTPKAWVPILNEMEAKL